MNRNREFVIKYCTDFFDQMNEITLRTMKHFHDWLKSLEKPILIISITERAGDPRYDKYFKEESK